jgi:hypothetical protein
MGGYPEQWVTGLRWLRFGQSDGAVAEPKISGHCARLSNSCPVEFGRKCEMRKYLREQGEAAEKWEHVARPEVTWSLTTNPFNFESIGLISAKVSGPVHGFLNDSVSILRLDMNVRQPSDRFGDRIFPPERLTRFYCLHRGHWESKRP